MYIYKETYLVRSYVKNVRHKSQVVDEKTFVQGEEALIFHDGVESVKCPGIDTLVAGLNLETGAHKRKGIQQSTHSKHVQDGHGLKMFQ